RRRRAGPVWEVHQAALEDVHQRQHAAIGQNGQNYQRFEGCHALRFGAGLAGGSQLLTMPITMAENLWRGEQPTSRKRVSAVEWQVLRHQERGPKLCEWLGRGSWKSLSDFWRVN